MPALYVLKVPEFEPMLAAVKAYRKEIMLEEAGPYVRLASSGPLSLKRERVGLGVAVWFGALTGGYVGRIERFDDHELRIVDGQTEREPRV